ncbi:hypothetical protein M406DRAFT_355061 [Cryphonectria parasitica EP155]|uniref:SCP domain-containing protein n=1 Tax=Cryphonectria parasitica (strain ATCC 38755 / EP155) TaxID=660469 RepID=A0A9P5CRS4_CRYP1|nr:uncharacterized protein M406DRAFT_355061 [Cryphonectria parasitica EP155]KAF3768874.1 hypothetical protein M406DRAFT_355061 [Cryphonectria parasitica EP155]
MRSSLLLLSGAAATLASPLRAREVDVVVEVVTQTTVVDVQYTVTDVVAAPAATPTSTEVAVAPVVTVTVAPSSTEEAGNVNVIAAPTTSSSSVVVVAATTSASSAATSPTDFAGIAVYQHNIHRANSSAPDVTYNDTAAGYAATLAARCVFEHDVTIGVTDGQAYGQNIAYIAGSDLTTDINTFLASSITNSWFDNEIELYPGYGSEPDMTLFDSWGHYSQVVWKGSNSIGCAVQACEAGTLDADYPGFFSVCNYWPAGNVETEYADNVLAPLGQANVYISS